MIYFIESDTSPGSPFPEISTGEYVRPRGLIAVGGPPVADKLPKDLTFYVTDGNPDAGGATDFMRGVGFLLASEKLKRVLEDSEADVEFIPIRVVYKDVALPDYFIANPQRRVRGADLGASRLELDEAGIALSVDKLVLDEARFTGIPLAVLHETLHIAVQAELAGAIKDARCTGCKFIEPASIQF
jgi:hypothetical protein